MTASLRGEGRACARGKVLALGALATLATIAMVPAGAVANGISESPAESAAADSTTWVRPPRLLGHGFGFSFARTVPTPLTVQSLDPSRTLMSSGGRNWFEVSSSDAWLLGIVSNVPVFLEWNKSLGFSLSQTTTSTPLVGAGTGSTLLTFGAPPTGSIDLDTSTGATTDASSTATVTDGTGDTATIVTSASSPPGGAVSQFAVSATAEGGVFTAQTTNGTTGESAAYAAIYDADGFAFLGSGDVGTTSLDSTWNDSILLIEQEFLVGRPVDTGTDWDMTVKAGPAYTFTNRNIRRTETVMIASTVPATTLPEIGIIANDRLTTHAVGIAGGASLSRELTDDWNMSLSASGALSVFRTTFVAQSTVIGATGVPVETNRQVMWGLNGRAGVQVGFSRTLSNGAIGGLSLFGERRWNEPSLETSTGTAPIVVVTGGGDNADFTGTSAPVLNSVLTKAGSWKFGVGLSYSYTF